MPHHPSRIIAFLALWAAVGVACGGCVTMTPPPAAVGAVADAPLSAAFASPTALPGVPNFAEVAPGVYRGAQPTAEGFRQLERLGVRTVVNLRAFHDDQELLAGTSLRQVRVRCAPWDVGRGELERVLAVVDDPASGRVFIHCQHGADRTGYVVAGYRLIRQGWDATSAIAELDRFGFHAVWRNIPTRLRELAAAVPGPAAAAMPEPSRPLAPRADQGVYRPG
ncbi:MAG: protein tyrosine phosphatase [Phycisphaerales bacterium]|nr:protein tyrosine phosphatase [Phycisphaerales bacterium]